MYYIWYGIYYIWYTYDIYSRSCIIYEKNLCLKLRSHSQILTQLRSCQYWHDMKCHGRRLMVTFLSRSVCWKILFRPTIIVYHSESSVWFTLTTQTTKSVEILVSTGIKDVPFRTPSRTFVARSWMTRDLGVSSVYSAHILCSRNRVVRCTSGLSRNQRLNEGFIDR